MSFKLSEELLDTVEGMTRISRGQNTLRKTPMTEAFANYLEKLNWRDHAVDNHQQTAANRIIYEHAVLKAADKIADVCTQDNLKQGRYSESFLAQWDSAFSETAQSIRAEVKAGWEAIHRESAQHPTQAR